MSNSATLWTVACQTLLSEIFQARTLEWVAIPFSSRSSWTRIEPVSLKSPALAGGFFSIKATCIEFTQLLESAGFVFWQIWKVFTIISLNTFFQFYSLHPLILAKNMSVTSFIILQVHGTLLNFFMLFLSDIQIVHILLICPKLFNFDLHHHWSPPVVFRVCFCDLFFTYTCFIWFFVL